MTSETIDRRVRKTRATLRLCLGRLLKEKKIQEISVKEISEMADINRGTFYLHYRDVYDLLSHIESDLFQQYNEILDRHKPAEIKESPKMLFTDLLRFIRENADLVQILMGPNGDIRFLNQLREVFRTKIMEPWSKSLNPGKESNYPYFYSFITEGTIGIIKRWVENGTDLAPEDMASLAEGFIMTGASGMQAKTSV